MRVCLLALITLLAVACQKPTHILTSVAYIPPATRSLALLASADGRATLDIPEPFELAQQPAPDTQSLLLTPSDDALARVQLSVAAFDQPGAMGCILAVGAIELELARGANIVQIGLSPAMHDSCIGKRPLILGAAPNLGSTGGGEVTLTGWGFQPESRVTFAGKSASITYVSPMQLRVQTPLMPGIGPADIRVENPDGGFDLRADLFRFYSETPSFATLDLDPGAGFTTPYFVVGPFSSKTQTDVAIVMPAAASKVRFISTVAGMLQPALTREYTVGDGAGAPVAADFDRDGDLDLVVVNSRTANFQLLKNDGSGTFQVGPLHAASIIGTGGDPSVIDIAAGDLNGDSIPDLVISNVSTSAGSMGGVQVLINNGDGTAWTTSSLVLGGFRIRAPSIADINYDSQPDIVIASEFPMKQIVVLLNQGQGRFTNDGSGKDIAAVPTSGTGMDVVTHDADGNGYPDILVSVPTSSLGLPRISVIQNSGGLQAKPYDLIATAPTGQLLLADVNGDSVADLMTTAGADGLVFFLAQPNTGFTETQPKKHPTGCVAAAQRFATADFNQDSRTDFLVQAPGCFKLLLNQSN